MPHPSPLAIVTRSATSAKCTRAFRVDIGAQQAKVGCTTGTYWLDCKQTIETRGLQ